MKKFIAFVLFMLPLSFYAYKKDPLMTNKIKKAGEHCAPCEGGVAPLSKKQIDEQLEAFLEWKLLENPYKIERIFTFKNFMQSMKFVNEVAQLAENEGHHPDITIAYNKVTIQIYTHAIQGLSINDFILAGFIDELLG